MNKIPDSKLSVWKPEVCDFSIYSVRLRSKVRSKGTLYTKVLDGDLSDFKGIKFQQDGNLKTEKGAKEPEMLQAELNAICTQIYDLIINSIDIGPTKHIVSAGVIRWSQCLGCVATGIRRGEQNSRLPVPKEASRPPAVPLQEHFRLHVRVQKFLRNSCCRSQG